MMNQVKNLRGIKVTSFRRSKELVEYSSSERKMRVREQVFKLKSNSISTWTFFVNHLVTNC